MARLFIRRGRMSFIPEVRLPRQLLRPLVPMGEKEAKHIVGFLEPGLLFRLNQQHQSDYTALSALATLGFCR